MKQSLQIVPVEISVGSFRASSTDARRMENREEKRGLLPRMARAPIMFVGRGRSRSRSKRDG